MTDKADRFIRLTWELLDGEAFQGLSVGARSALLFIWRRHNGFNNGKIECCKRDIVKFCHCGDHKALAYLKELQDANLISRTQMGKYHR
jgi:hypothetical protein